MNRMLVVLAAVCLPMLSVAAPPITEPVDVNVTNPVLPVEVSNSDPIPVSVATDATANIEGSREIFSKSVNVNFGNGGGACSAEMLEVPTGKRVVVENISGLAYLVQPAQLVEINLRTSSSDALIVVPAFPPFPSSSVSTNYYVSAAGQQTRFYSDVSLRICATANSPSSSSVAVAISGYYVERP